MFIPEKYYRGTFVGLNIFKIAEAAAQILLGLLLLFTTSVTKAILFLTERELIEDPTSFFATNIQSFLQNTPHIQFFGALYMLAFGLLKAFLIWGLLKRLLWTYPAALSFLAVVFLFQLAKLYETHPVLLVYLSILDIIFAALTWHEYKYLLVEKAAQKASQ